MRFLFFSLLICIPFLSFAQINQTDDSGLRQGKWQKKYPNGRLMYEGEFKDGEPVGNWTRYHTGGQVKAKIEYDEKSDSAFVQLFDNRGKKIAQGAYIDEKKEGKWTFFSENVKFSEEQYVNDKKHGTSRKFYPTGEVMEEAEWENGLQQGKYQVFFKNGKPYMQCKFSNGKRNGLCLSYFKNGRLEMEAHYKNNLRHDDWKFYSDSGELLYTLKYNEGVLLNPEVRDSIGNQEMKNLEQGRQNIPDPGKFMQDPSEYMRQMQKGR